jgi:hypothetical protein
MDAVLVVGINYLGCDDGVLGNYGSNGSLDWKTMRG